MLLASLGLLLTRSRSSFRCTDIAATNEKEATKVRARAFRDPELLLPIHRSRLCDTGILIREDISRRAPSQEERKGRKRKIDRKGKAMPRARAQRNDISTTDQRQLADSLGRLLRACRLRTYLN